MAGLTDVVLLINSGRYAEALRILGSDKELLERFMKYVKNAKEILRRMIINTILRTKKIPENNLIFKMFENDPYVRQAILFIRVEQAKGIIDKYARDKDLVSVTRFLVENYRKFGQFGKQIIYYALAKFIEETKNEPERLLSVLRTFKIMFGQLGITPPENVKRLLDLGEKLYNIEKNEPNVAKEIKEKILSDLKKKIKDVIEEYRGNIGKALSSPRFIALLELAGVPKAIIETAKILASTGLHELMSEFANLVKSLSGANIEVIAEKWSRVYGLAKKIYDRLNEYKEKLGEYYEKYMDVLKKGVKAVGVPTFYYYLRKKDLDKARRVLEEMSSLGIDVSKYYRVMAMFQHIFSAKISPSMALRIIHEVR